MKILIKHEDGNVIIMTAITMMVLLGFGALSVDLGMLYTAKNQLQAAVDSSALAGASGLIVNQSESTTRAIQYAGLNNCINQPVVVNNGNITFPTNTRITVIKTMPVNLYFANVLGFRTANVTARATAEIGPIIGTPGLGPWAVPDTIPSMYAIGERVVIKSSSNGAPGTHPGWFYPVDFPPVYSPTSGIDGDPVSGANEYRDNIRYGTDVTAYIGDILSVEPGNMIGPTRQGINDLTALDPGAMWNNGQISGSAYPGFDSPRIVKIPFFDLENPPVNGRSTLEIIAFGAFFVEGLQGNDVVGRFIQITTPGQIGSGGINSTHSSITGVHLVE